MKRKKRIPRRPKTKSLSWWKRIADSVFSEYIRRKDAIDERAKCVTCGNVDFWKKLQNGHYISRNHLSTRYLEKNCHVQCIGCNMFKSGNMDEYALFLLKTYGEGILQELQKEKQKIKKMGVQDYQELIEVYKKKIAELAETK